MCCLFHSPRDLSPSCRPAMPKEMALGPVRWWLECLRLLTVPEADSGASLQLASLWDGPRPQLYAQLAPLHYPRGSGAGQVFPEAKAGWLQRDGSMRWTHGPSQPCFSGELLHGHQELRF
jgi:hypothetical protein